MEKTLLQDGTYRYTGSLFGFNFDIVKANDDDFALWIKQKLLKYLLHPKMVLLLKDILGITDLENRVSALEGLIK